MPFKGLTIKEKMQIAESVVPFDLSFNRRCPGIFALPNPCIGFNESNYKDCKFNSTETICGFSILYKELEDINKNRKYLTYNEKREIAQQEKTKCLSHQPGRNCPLDNKDVDPNTFCEAYKQGDGYICNAAAKDDPIEDEYDIKIKFNGCTDNVR